MSEQQDPNSWLMTGSVKSTRFQSVGDYVVGHIMHTPQMQQVRDINTKQPKYWDDGKPQMQMRVILMTEERDQEDEDDDGQRAVYIKGQMQRSVADAVRKAGAPGLQIGGKLMITYTGDGKASGKGMNPPKLYEAKYRAPEPPAVPVPGATSTPSYNDVQAEELLKSTAEIPF